jgi:hypothetical protein
MKKVLIIIATITFCNCSVNNKNTSDNKNQKAEKISIISLISNPEKYHKKRIIVDGYFNFQKEGDAIYVNKSDYENLLYKNGIYLSISQEFLERQNIQPPYKGYVSIEGIFNKDKLGSYGFYSGTLEEVISISRLYKKGSLNDVFNMD